MQLNKLILGTVQMGLPYGINNNDGQISLNDSLYILKTAYENGIRYLDTAEAYGSAHDVIGKYHESFPQQTFHIITKLPHEINGNILVNIEKYFNTLKIKKLYALLFHSYQSYKGNMDQFELLNKLKSDGKLAKVGVSVYNNDEIAEVMNDENIDIIQFPYNIFDNLNLRGGILQQAKNMNKIIHTRSCFLQGLFFSPSVPVTKAAEALSTELSKIRNISEKNNISIQRIALNYCLQEERIDNVLIGVDNINQLIENLEDSKQTIPNGIVKEINSIKIENKNLLNPSLWSSL